MIFHLVCHSDCSKSFKGGVQHVTVHAHSFSYGGEGTYSCPIGSDLFYKNATRRHDGPGFCSANALWTDQDYLECWNGECHL